jgi:hypothetical protein
MKEDRLRRLAIGVTRHMVLEIGMVWMCSEDCRANAPEHVCIEEEEWLDEIEKALRTAQAERDQEWCEVAGEPHGADEGPVYCAKPSCVIAMANRKAKAEAFEEAAEFYAIFYANSNTHIGVRDQLRQRARELREGK